jgi:hypothetical protein
MSYFLLRFLETGLMARTQLPITSPRIPSNSVCPPFPVTLHIHFAEDVRRLTNIQRYPLMHLRFDFRNSCQLCRKRIQSPSLLELWPGGECYFSTLLVSSILPSHHRSHVSPTRSQHGTSWIVRQELISSADNFADQFVDQKISISDYSLSASVACGKFCCATVRPFFFPIFHRSVADEQEEMWDIV